MAEHRIETNIEINAPVGRVWALLTDFAGMPSWNPFIKSISGNLHKVLELSVQIAPPGMSGMRFKPTVLFVRHEASCAGWVMCSFQAFLMASTTFCSNPSRRAELA